MLQFPATLLMLGQPKAKVNAEAARTMSERPSADRLVGMLTEENIQEYLQVHEATGDASESSQV